MPENRECRSCSGNVRLTPEEIKRKYVDPLNIKRQGIVNDMEYERRLSICFSCPSLKYGTTCMHCGCLVQVRAKLAGSSCPYPYAPKWDRAVVSKV